MNRRVAGLVGVLVTISACGPSVDDAALVWQREHPDSYVFEYQSICVCPGSGLWWRVTVRDDSVVASELLDSTAIRNGLGASLKVHPTITQLFDGLTSMTHRPHSWTKIRYDPEWHYPVSAKGDATDQNNSHFQITLRNFKPLP